MKLPYEILIQIIPENDCFLLNKQFTKYYFQCRLSLSTNFPLILLSNPFYPYSHFIRDISINQSIQLIFINNLHQFINLKTLVIHNIFPELSILNQFPNIFDLTFIKDDNVNVLDSYSLLPPLIHIKSLEIYLHNQLEINECAQLFPNCHKLACYESNATKPPQFNAFKHLNQLCCDGIFQIPSKLDLLICSENEDEIMPYQSTKDVTNLHYIFNTLQDGTFDKLVTALMRDLLNGKSRVIEINSEIIISNYFVTKWKIHDSDYGIYDYKAPGVHIYSNMRDWETDYGYLLHVE
eukprot:NODE_975_length_2816_cov_0.464851.p1 type:complete len:294 gc:universal NODE_975_length_2816_cov_0.464851:2636-1755(-)